ncbi:PEP-CTERM sorting domain-containing protein [Nostoc sp. UHCC 0252]|uniref:PEP-CTERM sorting domain-containing protein n=1 Tax=Nostoc sp. UHCC 0252 TaxID=3110241 RepID=UPI002B21B97B|nr:PEP-CTERM sorting domain-containing protein [Nostoc sp. UHCC 0252]MEA5605997.1 PEP-CTERM sorting domain-containing protein [Nostoc sp. UHCC 0252]
MKKLPMAAATAAIVALGTLGTQKAEAFTIFTSRTDWNTAVIGSDTFVEDFESFTFDTEFRTTPVNVGEFTLLRVGTSLVSEEFRNFIEVPPFQYDDNNGTNHASVFTEFGSTTVDLTLKTPVFAWGADFFGAETGERLNLDLVLDMGGVFTTIPVTVNNGFFGFVTNPVEDIRKVTFRSRINDDGGEGFGLDNVTGASFEVRPVPETSTVFGPIMALGFGAVLKRGYSRRQKKAKCNC